MHRGYVKLWRKISDWEWYKSSETFHLLFHLVMNANYKDSKYMGHVIKRGEIVTGRLKLSQQTGLSIQTVRTCINRLKSTNELTTRTTNQFTVITICNYDTYNSDNHVTNQEINQVSNQQLTINQPTTNHQLTTSKEIKKEKKEKKVKNIKHKYGEYSHVLLTDKELGKLKADLGEQKALDMIKELDEGIELKGYKYSNCYLAIKKWYAKKQTQPQRPQYGKIEYTQDAYQRQMNMRLE